MCDGVCLLLTARLAFGVIAGLSAREHHEYGRSACITATTWAKNEKKISARTVIGREA